MNTAEQDYKALRYCVERSHGTALSKGRLLKRIEKDFRQGKRIQAPDSSWRKAFCCARLMMGDYSRWDGWEFRSDYAATCWFEGEGRLGLPKWNGAPVEHLLVLAEEGVGDEVLFMSLLPEALVRCPRVTVECDRRLESILRRSFPRTETIPRLGTLTKIREWLASAEGTATRSAQCPAQPTVTAWCLMGDLARFFRRDRTHFPGKPYLRPDPERVSRLREFAGRVGVSWSGNHGRYDPFEFAWSAPGDGPYLNLQYDGTAPFLEEPGIDLKNDLEGLFALCSVLSKVVSVSTSIAHIAGSVGCPVDVIHAPPGSGGKNDMDILNWKWGAEGTTPWYGSARVFRNLKQHQMTR